MANIKQQIKRNITNGKNRLKNASFKSAVKTSVKAVEAACNENKKEEAVKAYNLTCAKLDKGLAKGIFHKNFVANNKSRLAKLVNSIA